MVKVSAHKLRVKHVTPGTFISDPYYNFGGNFERINLCLSSERSVYEPFVFINLIWISFPSGRIWRETSWENSHIINGGCSDGIFIQ